MEAKRTKLAYRCIVVVLPTRSDPALSMLTASEKAIARAMLAGASNKLIGRVRRTSTRTVANQVQSIFRKLSVSSRSDLVLRFGDVEFDSMPDSSEVAAE